MGMLRHVHIERPRKRLDETEVAMPVLEVSLLLTNLGSTGKASTVSPSCNPLHPGTGIIPLCGCSILPHTSAVSICEWPLAVCEVPEGREGLAQCPAHSKWSVFLN